MYADQRYTPRSPRTVSIAAALAVNGLVIAGLISFVPNVIPRAPSGGIKIFEPVETPPPPEQAPKPRTEVSPRQADPYIPQPLIPQPDQPQMQGSDVLPLDPPRSGPVVDPGPANIVEPPATLPPLIGAQQDSRFAQDFQPEYPAQELRAQRDGRVSVRVLIGVDGRVKAIEQVSATSPAFFEATKRQALGKWRFKPAARGGVPQESWKTMSVRFELKNA